MERRRERLEGWRDGGKKEEGWGGGGKSCVISKRTIRFLGHN